MTTTRWRLVIRLMVVLLGSGPLPGVTHPRPAAQQTPPPLTSPHPTAPLTARVVQIVDGDTIDVELQGQRSGHAISASTRPRRRHPTRGVEPYRPEAAEANTRLVAGHRHTVCLECDVLRRDRDGRLFAYVCVGDAMINAELVRQGDAQAATLPPNVTYLELFLRLQRQAQEAWRRLWGTQ